MEWLVPFKGRNFSGACDQNLLWRNGSFFVMDNHRAALWCWYNSINLCEDHSLVHVDRHFDTLQSRLDEWLDNMPSNWNPSIEEYLSYKYKASDHTASLVRWDNYLSLYFAIFREHISRCVFFTHGEGDQPNFDGIDHRSSDDLINWLDRTLSEGGNWIVNVDLDYFFRENENSDVAVRNISTEDIGSIGALLKKGRDMGVFKTITIAMSPDEDLTGGWDVSEQLATELCAHVGETFKLP